MRHFLYSITLSLAATVSDGLAQQAALPDSNSLTTLTDPERQELHTQLQASLEKFNSVVANLSPGQLAFRPQPGTWTLAECIEHVTLAELRFPDIVTEAMQQPADPAFRRKIKIKDEAIRPRMTSRSWRAKSPEVFRPTGRFADVTFAIQALQSQRNKTMTYASQTSDDLRNHYWRHPLTGYIDLYQTLLLMSAHLERHVAQMEQIKEAEAFPRP
ncbi:DinB family protein [Spirosoma aerophilum]